MNELCSRLRKRRDDSSSPSSSSTSSSSSLNKSLIQNNSIMGEDDIVELLWKSGQVVRSSQTHRPSFPPPILRGSGSGGGGEENAPLLPLHSHQQPSDQNLFIHEDEMASWLQHPLREDEFRSSHLFHSGVVSIPFTQPQGALSLTPPPPSAEALMGQVIASRRAENFINFSSLRGNIYGDGRVEPAPPWLPVVRGSTQVGSSATPSSSATESSLTPATFSGGVSQTFAVPSLSGKAFEMVCDIAGPSSSVVSRTETEPVQIQPPAETEPAGDRKRKEREETADETAEDTEETAEEARGSTSRKRSRAAEMHNISERRRREKINEKMKALQELIPRCNKTDKASMLEDAIEYVKSLQTQIQMMSMGGGGMMPMMYTPDMQRFMPHAAMGMMGLNRPPFIPLPGTAIPRPAHMAGQGPSYPAPRYPSPNIQAFDPSRVHIPSQQPDPVPNQPQFPGYMNPYSQFVGLHQMQQQPPPPPTSENQTTSQLSFSQASTSKEPEDQDNKPTGSKG